MTSPTARPDNQRRWPYPEHHGTVLDHTEGSRVTEADADDLRTLGLGPGHRVLVVWR